MDITIRRNEECVIGLPKCDYVFSSTRSCFIAYGFEESTLEMTVLRNLLEKRGVQAIEAGGTLAPAQSAYCAKICSKIITSQFCIVLLNNDERDGIEVPNANVNMEYGLMLGFNKYVIPFQRKSQRLPFNVAGLDTIKYDDRNFERTAAEAIDEAIGKTTQPTTEQVPIDDLLGSFLLTKSALIAPLHSEGEKNLFELGRPLGFNLLSDFGGTQGIFFGNFTHIRPETAVLRARTLEKILVQRVASLQQRVKLGMVPRDQLDHIIESLEEFQVWILVTSDEDRDVVAQGIAAGTMTHKTEVFSIDDVHQSLMDTGFDGPADNA